MNIHEARMIATLRIHYGCTFSKLAGLARAIWGEDHCKEMGRTEYGYGSPLGRALVTRMEKSLGLDMCESDNMIMTELVCMKCKRTSWSICYPSDAEKECEHCGYMAQVLKATEGEG